MTEREEEEVRYYNRMTLIVVVASFLAVGIGVACAVHDAATEMQPQDGGVQGKAVSQLAEQLCLGNCQLQAAAQCPGWYLSACQARCPTYVRQLEQVCEDEYVAHQVCLASGASPVYACQPSGPAPREASRCTPTLMALFTCRLTH